MKYLIFLALLCIAATPLRSPKDAGDQPLKISLPAIVVTPSRTITWGWTPDTSNPSSNIVYRILQTTDLQTPLTYMGVVNTNTYRFNMSFDKQFFAVQASNTVTHLINQ